MITAKVRPADAKRLERKLRQDLPDAIHKGAVEAVQNETQAIVADMRNNAPEQTGALKKGIREEVTGTKGEAISTAPYSSFVEHGTSSAPAQPFAQPAAERARRRFPGTVRDDLRAELRKVGD